MDEYLVYILKSKITGYYYCGQTKNFPDRFNRHNSGRSKSTKHGAPWEVVRLIKCKSRSEAMAQEKKIKKRGIERFLKDLDN